MVRGAHIESRTGATRQGSPLAWSRAPAEDLREWFYWWSVAEGRVAPGAHITCGRLSDHASIMILFGDPWILHTVDGAQCVDPGKTGCAILWGPQTQRLPVEIAGHYIVIKLQLNAGAATALGVPDQSSLLNKVVPLEETLGWDRPVAPLVPREESYERWLQALEESVLRPWAAGKPRVDKLVTDFECATLADPALNLNAFADQHKVCKRTVERAIRKAFGITPKQAQRRARALDMGAALLDVARPEDRDEIELRYFDQSHRSREIREFFGLLPSQLRAGDHPFLRISLEARQRRRLDALNHLAPDELGPWRNPNAEPRSGRADTAADER